MKKKIGAALLAGMMCLSVCSTAAPQMKTKVSAASGCTVEYLDRGISAVSTGSGMLVSWRFLANDPDDAIFKLYRDNTLVYTSNAGDATCFLDAGGSAGSSYKVETYSGTSLVSSETCKLSSGANYFDIKLSNPGSGYTPNDCSVGDVDGDGQYELFVKWDPSNSKDNSQKGKTGKVYIDCYRLDSTRLWRIDLGVNIRAGAHYTQFFVADFDLDGKAEMTCKTADGTIDGTGKAIGDASASYVNGDGLIITGPEYYTLFDGETGAALDTIDYEPGRGDTTKWGKTSDKFNRVDRFWGVVAYLDGVRPSVVTGRGYYGRMTATAYTVENDKLVKLWAFDTGTSSSTPGYGDGNHNSMPADVDGDGRQEIITGSTCIDDDGTLKWNTNQGHGDAMHVGDLVPENPGIEVYICHEDKPYGVSLLDGETGSKIFHVDGSGDTGRCCADNVWSGNAGAEFWGNGNDVYNASGSTLTCRRPAINFLSYWDGDLEREILDGYTDSPATITDMGADGKLTTLLTTDGYYTCNTTKGTPCLSADLFGDWREELVVRAADGNSVRIYTTTYDTDYRITTLMHDAQYRNQVASQNVAYNQPPHASFYLGSEAALPDRPDVNVGENTAVKPGAVMDTAHKYTIQNVNSGLFLEVEGAAAANGTNVSQGNSGGMVWTLEEAGDGYYRIYSELGDGKTYLLDLDYGKPDNGTNIGIWGDTASDAQLFKFVDKGDGSYEICTKATQDASCIGIVAGSTEVGANVVQWACDGSANQAWKLNIVVDPIDGVLVQNLLVKDLTYKTAWNYQNYRIDTDIQVGDLVFGDREVTYTALPEEIIGGEAILTACDSKYATGDTAVFTAGADMTVYVAIDSRLFAEGGNGLPAWAAGYTNTGLTAVSSNDVTFNLYSLAVKQGDTVTLGENGQSTGCVHYTVFAVKTPEPVETTEPPTEPITEPPTAEPTTEAPTAEPTTEPAEPGTVLYGDVDLNDTVNITDVIALSRSLMGGGAPLNAQQSVNADCDANGTINTSDALAIMKYLVKLVESLPV